MNAKMNARMNVKMNMIAQRKRQEYTDASTRRRFANERKGATMIEFALVLPIIFSLFFGLWEYSRIEMMQQAADTACYEAARTGTLPGATAEMMTSAANRVLDIYLVDGSIVSPMLDDEFSRCEIVVPVDENTWFAYFVIPDRSIVTECQFLREIFGGG